VSVKSRSSAPARSTRLFPLSALARRKLHHPHSLHQSPASTTRTGLWGGARRWRLGRSGAGRRAFLTGVELKNDNTATICATSSLRRGHARIITAATLNWFQKPHAVETVLCRARIAGGAALKLLSISQNEVPRARYQFRTRPRFRIPH